MVIRSLGLAAALVFVGATASQASIPTGDVQDGFGLQAETTIAAAPGDLGDSPIIIARRGNDDRSGDDHGRRGRGKDDKKDGHKHRDRDRDRDRHHGNDDGPNHT